MFGLYFRATPPASYAEVMQCDKDAFNRFFHAMLDHGIYFAPSAFEAGFVSAAHSARISTRPSGGARGFWPNGELKHPGLWHFPLNFDNIKLSLN